MHASHALSSCALLLLLALLFSCAAETADEGATEMDPPTIGMPCSGRCETGLTCASTGRFARQCTAGCNNAAACQLLPSGAGTQCFGSAMPECGLPCSSDMQCPMGTTCQMLDTGMACKIPLAMP